MKLPTLAVVATGGHYHQRLLPSPTWKSLRRRREPLSMEPSSRRRWELSTPEPSLDTDCLPNLDATVGILGRERARWGAGRGTVKERWRQLGLHLFYWRWVPPTGSKHCRKIPKLYRPSHMGSRSSVYVLVIPLMLDNKYCSK